ncbi:MAG TPA: sulfotransferase [Steroidobacteraceae bacterium]|nr:sulfotransferase [Steroidobacteraceae bacterium]
MLTAASEVDFRLIRVAAMLESNPLAAAREAAQIVRSHPGHAAALLLLGNAHRASGNTQAAAAEFTELAAAHPDSAPVQLELGRTLAAQGEAEPAIAALCEAIRLQPDLAEAWAELAALYAARGDPKACDEAYANFARLAPPERHLAEAAAALAARRLTSAESRLRERLARAPRDVGAMRLLAEVAAEREDYVEAERLLGECLTLAPGYGVARLSLARILHSQQKAAPMLPLLERLLALEPDNFKFRTLQASAYNLLGQNERARQIHEQMLGEFPESELLWLYYGHTLRLAGRLTEAVAAYRKSAQLKPQFGEAWFSLANLKTVRFSDEDIQTMQGQAARAELDDNARLHFEFALGKAYEDQRVFAASFEHYARGNALRRAMVNYEADSSTRFVERARALYTPEFFAARAGSGNPAPDPIFIVGLPRSGSTLLEQILASHSQVEGTRELPDIPGFALELGALEQPGRPQAYPASIARLERAQLTALGDRYLEQIRSHRVLGRPRFVDKMPSNFSHVGLIHLLLPNAKIIDARRAPLACCFANFKQHFQSGAWFTYDLADLGRYYRDYVQLMRHFDAVLPGRVHRVQYEDLVTDLDGEVRRLLAYCGLPFEEQCLRFYETERVVQTVSSDQVRKPLYADAVEQWRNYEPWLGPLKEALGELVGPEQEPDPT